MYYEYRRYEAAVSKAVALDRRFEEVTLGLFKRHDIDVVGLWHTYVGDRALHYILRWRSLEHMEKAWAAFDADPEWQKAKAESERDGQLTRTVANEIWTRAPYSPAI
ncbi:MAG: NIPSNAP family protein [Parvibaculaceae bacterium]